MFAMLYSLKIVELIIIFLALFVMVFFLLLTLLNMKKRKRHYLKVFPSVSIIIPVYNEEKYLKKCVESVTGSNYPKQKLEILIIDDGSTDETPKIGKELSKKYENVKYFRKDNSGKADSLNYGIKKARGEIIGVLDADTFVDRNAIKNQVWHIVNGADAVTGVAKVYNVNKNILTKLQNVEYLFTAFVRKVLEGIDSIYVTPGTLSMYKSIVLKKVGGFDVNNLLEDQEIAMRLQSLNYKIESCLESVVYTVVPETFTELLKQRERWHRGGLRNAFKYIHLINPSYGDFGILIMPLSIISIIFMFALLLIVIVVRLSNPPSPPYLLVFDPSFVLGSMLFLLTLIWTELNLRAFEDEVPARYVILYLVTYAYFITFVWVVSIIKEILLIPPKWR